MRAGSQACLSVCVLCINTLVGTFLGGRGLLFVVVGGHFCRSLLCNHVLVVKKNKDIHVHTQYCSHTRLCVFL